MKLITNLSILLISVVLLLPSCVSKKALQSAQADLAAKQLELENAEKDMTRCEKSIIDYQNKLNRCEQDKVKMQGDINASRDVAKLRNEQLKDLKTQIEDFKAQRDKQLNQVDNLTVLSGKATDNIKETLKQLGQKDDYIQLIQMAKSRADSMNLALAVNLKSVLKDGVADDDVEVKVDKTVVFINLSDKMLYQSGSATLTTRAKEVLGKIAKIIESRPGLEVMVEGYTDNVPLKSVCMNDNWDLSVIRATAVVRTLHEDYNINPNRLIAAGRGQYNALGDNSTAAGRSLNRRTRIIILPKLDQFYDLLNPNKVPK